MGNQTGNLADLINNLFDTNSQAINDLSSLIGAVADTAGAVEGVIQVVDLFTSQPDPLPAVLAEVQKEFAQLYAYLTAWQNEQEWQKLADLVSSAESVVDTLDGVVHGQPPPTDFERFTYIDACVKPLDALSDQTIRSTGAFFVVPYSVQVYWTDSGSFQQDVFSYNDKTRSWVVVRTVDVGYGLQAPSPPPDNQVLFYLYVMPYYLKAVFLLVSVGGSLFSDFGKSKQRQQDALIKYAKFLTTIHDLIAGSITKLAPPPPPWVHQPVTPASPINPVGGFVRGIQGTLTVVPPTKSERGTVDLVKITPIWGAVEKFSGASSMRWSAIRIAGAIDYESVFKKLQVRARREAMNVYAAVGLPKVWNAINNLYGIAGQPLIPQNQYARWSFREIFRQAGVGARGDQNFHLSDMASLIRHNPPLDTAPTGPYSWRNLLNA
jgi:hypothetical protein